MKQVRTFGRTCRLQGMWQRLLSRTRTSARRMTATISFRVAILNAARPAVILESLDSIWHRYVRIGDYHRNGNKHESCSNALACSPSPFVGRWQTILANQTSYATISGETFTGGVGRRVRKARDSGFLHGGCAPHNRPNETRHFKIALHIPHGPSRSSCA